jgi:hypothetical protein
VGLSASDVPVWTGETSAIAYLLVHAVDRGDAGSR